MSVKEPDELREMIVSAGIPTHFRKLEGVGNSRPVTLDGRRLSTGIEERPQIQSDILKLTHEREELMCIAPLREKLPLGIVNA